MEFFLVPVVSTLSLRSFRQLCNIFLQVFSTWLSSHLKIAAQSVRVVPLVSGDH